MTHALYMGGVDWTPYQLWLHHSYASNIVCVHVGKMVIGGGCRVHQRERESVCDQG